MQPNQPLWTPCECGEFYCTLHEQHACDCECPPIDEMDRKPTKSRAADNAALRARRIAEGLVHHRVWCTPLEKQQLVNRLAELRDNTPTKE